MELLDWLSVALRTLKGLLPPVEIALTLGAVFFALSWIRPLRTVSLPASGRRAALLTRLGIGGSLAVLAVATATSWLAQADPLQQWWFGWWQRPAPLLAATCVIAIAAIALRREPLPAPGERAIVPRRRWWAFTPRAPLWIAAGAATALFLTAAWHSLIGVSLPESGDHLGVGPGPAELPVYMRAFDGVGYIWGAGWPNHLATLLSVLLAAATLALALGGDANRPLSARATAADVYEERAATAHLLVAIALGGVLLALGAVWAHIGFIGEATVGISPQVEGGEHADPVYVGTGYSDFAFAMHKGGYVVQGIGAALLLRLAVDTWRAGRAGRGARARGPEAPASEAAESGRTQRPVESETVR